MKNLTQELTFKAVRSSGKGGQHVNKVSTKVELFFDIQQSHSFTQEQKERLLHKLKNKLNSNGVLRLTCQEKRSQLLNKELVTEKFYTLIEEALKVSKKRIPVKPTKAMKAARLRKKRVNSEKKMMRKKVSIDYANKD